MKPLRSILATSLALALLSTSASAITFQVTADTVGTPTVGAKPGSIKKASGAATTLLVSKTSTAFIDFGTGASGIPASSVSAARLVIFFPKVTKPGNLILSANGSAFEETFTTTTIPLPTAGAGIGSPIAVTVADSKNFLTIDVTAQVKAWLTNPGTDFGFSIAADSPTSLVNVTIGSKEGSGSGYPAVLEIDTKGEFLSLSEDPSSGNVGIGTTSPQAPLDVARTAAPVTIGTSTLTSSFALEVTNNDQAGTEARPDVAGIGFGAFDSMRQAIVGGTFGNDFLDFFTSGNFTHSRMRIDGAGNVGIGTITPSVLLDVAGEIHENGKSMPEAEEKLRIIRGTITGNGTIAKGSGFKIDSPHQTGSYLITFNTAFSDTPSVTTGILQPNSASPVTIPATAAGSFLVNTFSNATTVGDVPFSFIAVGPR